VGRVLARHFHRQGHAVTVLSRTPRPEQWNSVEWDGRTPGAWAGCLEGCDVLINLTGRSVNCRYGAANRREILESRVESTALLNPVVASLAHPPKVWLNAGTATIYRHSLDREMDEEGELGGTEPGAPASWRFSIAVAKAWEAAFFGTATPQTRKVVLRSAMTFSHDRGGVFDAFLGLVRHGLGGTIGSGSQYVSWVHEADFLRGVEFLMARQEFAGVVNIASPNPLPNREFIRALREAWGARVGVASPRWAVEVGAALLRTESELVLKSRRVVPGRLAAAGFSFLFPEWAPAARELVGRWRKDRV